MAEPVQVVLLSAFEPESGPIPGELTLWREHLQLTQRLPLSPAYRALYTDGKGTLALPVGVGHARAAASVMALGLDLRFDLRETYFLVTGVAGINPERGSLASVVLPLHIAEGDLTHEIDAREIPPDWPDGFVPIGKSTPYEQPLAARFEGDDGIVFHLNARLVEWAHELTRETPLLDTSQMSDRRHTFAQNAAKQPPSVLIGDELSSSTFFHGRLMSERAERWVAYQTEGAGQYAITAMEDAGILQSLSFLASAGYVDWNRILIARAASNYDQQRTGISAAESLAETRVVTYSAYRPALENAWRVGSRIVHALRSGQAPPA